MNNVLKPSPYSVGYAVAQGWLPENPVPTAQEFSTAIRGLFAVMPLYMNHDPKVAAAIKVAANLLKRVPS